MTAFFITGSGTDVGKTFITCGLIAALRARGQAVTAFKPVASGYDPATAAASDPGLILAALGEPVSEADIARIAPWRFAAPLSPDMAAAREGRALDFAALAAFTSRVIAGHQGTLFIEGVGGVMVPLDERRTTLDWMEAAALPTLLVTGSYLGALSHTLTAVAALKQRGIGIAALVVNESEGSTVPLTDTAATLARHYTEPLALLPRHAGLASFTRLADQLGL